MTSPSVVPTPLAQHEPDAAGGGLPDLALWVWDVSAPEETVEFAAVRGVARLYAAVPPDVGSSPALADLVTLSAAAATRGIRVDALGGDPDWVDDPAGVVARWLLPALATGLFTGVHVDIEPYSKPSWSTDRPLVVEHYLSTLEAIRDSCGGASLEADIPFWFDEVPAGASTLDREVLARTDGVTVMAYRNTAEGADGTIALAGRVMVAAAELGRPVRVGQETTFLGTDPVAVKQTFFGQTLTRLESQLDLVTAAFAATPGFSGLAIHDAVGWAAMSP